MGEVAGISRAPVHPRRGVGEESLLAKLHHRNGAPGEADQVGDCAQEGEDEQGGGRRFDAKTVEEGPGEAVLPAEVQEVEGEHGEGGGGVHSVRLGGAKVAHRQQAEGGRGAEKEGDSILTVKVIFQRGVGVIYLHEVEVN